MPPGLSRGFVNNCGSVAVDITDIESPSPEPSPKSRLIAVKISECQIFNEIISFILVTFSGRI
jgi:hypothetical protein